MSLSTRWLGITLSGLAALACVGCGSTGRPLPPPDAEVTVEPDVPVIIGDGAGSNDADLIAPEPCKILWVKKSVAAGSGGTSHPAQGKYGTLYVAGFGKLYAMGPSGQETCPDGSCWTWPDSDAGGVVTPQDEQLYTPVIGIEGRIIVGSGMGRVLVINRNGTSRFAVTVDGPVSGAVSVAQDGRFVVLDDTGSLRLVKDQAQNMPIQVWPTAGTRIGVDAPLPGVQPVISKNPTDASELILVPDQTGVSAFALSSGASPWKWPAAEGHTVTSHAILDKDGNALFLSGSDPVPNSDYFGRTWLNIVSPSGQALEGTPQLVYEGTAKATTLSQGRDQTLLIGTTNSGLLIYSRKLASKQWQFFENFEALGEPAQASDGLVYFAARPDWMFVVSETAEKVYRGRQEDPAAPQSADLAPASPLLLDTGVAIISSGHLLTALQCTDAGPAALTWGRFGGNNKNTGNLQDSPASEE